MSNKDLLGVQLTSSSEKPIVNRQSTGKKSNYNSLRVQNEYLFRENRIILDASLGGLLDEGRRGSSGGTEADSPSHSPSIWFFVFSQLID